MRGGGGGGGRESGGIKQHCHLRTFAPKNFPRTDSFKTLTAST